MSISFVHHGDFSKTSRFLSRAKKGAALEGLERLGLEGVYALVRATPVDTGKTAGSWGYRIVRNRESVRIEWTNSNVVDGVPIAVILQYGHGTRNGGWVEGRDYINPAIQPVFDKILKDAWAEVTRT